MCAPLPLVRVSIELHRRGEIEHIQTLRQLRRQLHVVEIERQLVARALQIGTDAFTGERHDDASFAVLAATKIDIRNFRRPVPRPSWSDRWSRPRWSSPSRCHAVVDRQHQIVALRLGLVSSIGRIQIDHHARAPGRFDGADAAGRAAVDVDAALAHGIARVGDVDGDARRIFGGENARLADRCRRTSA